jgi:hypothetical protein
MPRGASARDSMTRPKGASNRSSTNVVILCEDYNGVHIIMKISFRGIKSSLLFTMKKETLYKTYKLSYISQYDGKRKREIFS